jgi:hypothetical protein
MDEKYELKSGLRAEDPTINKERSLTIINDIESKSAVYINEPPNGGTQAWLAVFGGFLVSSVNKLHQNLYLMFNLFIGKCSNVNSIVYDQKFF